MEDEIWKPIPLFDKYEVSNTGNVRRKWLVLLEPEPVYKYKGVSMNPVNNKYIYVSLCQNNVKQTFYASRLVAEQFLPNPNNYKDVRYKDGDIFNNHVSNLEWYDRSATPVINKKMEQMKLKKQQEKERYCEEFLEKMRLMKSRPADP